MATKRKSLLKASKKPARAQRIMPTWQKSPGELVDFFASLMSSFPEAQVRKVFGYPCGFINGNMATGLHGNSLFVRLNAEDETKLLDVKGAAPFSPMPGRAMRGYVVVPEAFRKDTAKMHTWIRRALEHTSTLPPKVKK